MKKSLWLLLFVVFAAIMFTGCAHSVPESCLVDEPASFLKGLFHGFFIVFTFIGSWFSDNIAIYEANNTGGWYDFGFILGASMFLGGGGSKL